MRLARRVAAGYARRCPREADDILGAAVLGLADAAGRYDPDRGDFGTFARRRIVGEILDYCRNELPRRFRRRDRVDGPRPAPGLTKISDTP